MSKKIFNDYNELLQSFPADDYCTGGIKKMLMAIINLRDKRQRELEILTARKKKMKIDFTRINNNFAVAFN